jgi:hypothetical protein
MVRISHGTVKFEPMFSITRTEAYEGLEIKDPNCLLT